MNIIELLILTLIPTCAVLYIAQAFYYILQEIIEDRKQEKELKEYQENLKKNS
tara:strand:- start:341 stop:499 length:159 start_codon:yes stop_codon:yes gene_type:complete